MNLHKLKEKPIDNYISRFPKETQKLLNKMKRTIKESSLDSVETIGYGIPTFKLKENNLMHFAAFKNHIGFFPTPSAIVAFKKELSEYKTTKGAIQFPLDKPIPFDLVRKIVQYRVREILKK